VVEQEKPIWRHCPGSPTGAHHEVVNTKTGRSRCKYCSLILKYPPEAMYDPIYHGQPEVIKMPGEKRIKVKKTRRDKGGRHVKRSAQADAPASRLGAVPHSAYTVEQRLKIVQETERRGPVGIASICKESEDGTLAVGPEGEVLKVRRISKSTLKSWMKRVDYYKRVMEVGEKQALSELASKARGGAELRREIERLKAEVKLLREKAGKYDLAFALKGTELMVYEQGTCKIRFYVMDPEMMAVARRTVIDIAETYLRGLRPAVPQVEVKHV